MRKQITKTQEIKKGLIKQLLTKVDSTEFKNSPLGKIPKNWEMVKIEEVAEIKMGQSPSSSTYNKEGKGEYLIQGNADIKNRKSLPKQWTSEPIKTCSIGDILMTVRAPVGKVAKSIHQACIGRGICSIITKKADNEFLYQFLLSYESKWKALEQGSTFTAINNNDIKGVRLLAPPLPEQKKIAEILSTVDAKIEIIDQQVSKTQELKKGLMQRLLTKGIGHTEFKETKLGEIPESWEVLDLSKLSKVKGRSQKYTKADLVEEGQGALAIGGTQITKQNKLNFSKSVYFSWKKYNESPEIKVEVGNIVFAQRGTLGRLALIETLPEKATINPSMVLIKNIKCNKKFLFYYLCSTHVQNIVSCISASTAVPMISQKQIKGLKIAIPSNDEQSQIANILGSADEKLTILAEKKTKYQELKKGLMQQLLTGKIRVNHLINKPSNI